MPPYKRFHPGTHSVTSCTENTVSLDDLEKEKKFCFCGKSNNDSSPFQPFAQSL